MTAIFCGLGCAWLAEPGQAQDLPTRRADAPPEDKGKKSEPQKTEPQKTEPKKDAKGLALLDQAVDAQLMANSLQELGQVVQLLREAIEVGLDEANDQFAKKMLASTLVRRAQLYQEGLVQLQSEGAEFLQQLNRLRNVALSDLRESLALEPKQSQAYYLQGRFLALPGGDPNKAYDAFDAAVKYAKGAAEKAKALTARGVLQKNVQDMQADYDEAIRLAPDSAEAIRTRGTLFLQLGKLPDAINDLKKAVELAPEHLGTREALVLALLRGNSFDEAIEELGDWIELDPEDSRPRLQRARINASRKHYLAAVKDLDEILKQDPTDDTVRLMRAELQRQLGDLQAALIDADGVVLAQPGIQSALQLRAQVLKKSGKINEAIAALEKLSEGDLASPLTLMQLGMLHGARNDHEKAIPVYSQLVKMLPDSEDLWVARAGHYLMLGKHAEAVKDYDRALKLDPENSHVLNNLAWVLCTSPDDELRDGKRAIELASQGCELTNHSQSHLLSTLAAGYAEVGDFATAMKWINRALAVADDGIRAELERERDSYVERKAWREAKPEQDNNED